MQARDKVRQVALQRWADPDERLRLTLAMRRPPETREKMRQAHLRPECREKHRQDRLRQAFPTKMTSIERLLRAEFKKRRLKFEMHKTMFGRFQPDFVFENARLIIQADGDYWHSRPDMKERGARFDKMAHDNGWSVWRFGEKEIHMHAPACARAVARFVRDH